MNLAFHTINPCDDNKTVGYCGPVHQTSNPGIPLQFCHQSNQGKYLEAYINLIHFNFLSIFVDTNLIQNQTLRPIVYVHVRGLSQICLYTLIKF